MFVRDATHEAMEGARRQAILREVFGHNFRNGSRRSARTSIRSDVRAGGMMSSRPTCVVIRHFAIHPRQSPCEHPKRPVEFGNRAEATLPARYGQRAVLQEHNAELPHVRLRMDFRNPHAVGTFVYHCHLLDHEDSGMMGTVRVVAHRK
ncbi:multicopper oxidase domain-containing protein [Burkholderia stabilis]|uniref:multicopper oxidase domain-containing protein n=1 Tax=Burkholderia stabilis TaxID=95485 RepID=UPI003002E102